MEDDILSLIEDSKKASEIWGMSESNIKKLAQSQAIKAKKIGNSWAIDMTQPNPKKYRGRVSINLSNTENK